MSQWGNFCVVTWPAGNSCQNLSLILLYCLKERENNVVLEIYIPSLMNYGFRWRTFHQSSAWTKATFHIIRFLTLSSKHLYKWEHVYWTDQNIITRECLNSWPLYNLGSLLSQPTILTNAPPCLLLYFKYCPSASEFIDLHFVNKS